MSGSTEDTKKEKKREVEKAGTTATTSADQRQKRNRGNSETSTSSNKSSSHRNNQQQQQLQENSTAPEAASDNRLVFSLPEQVSNNDLGAHFLPQVLVRMSAAPAAPTQGKLSTTLLRHPLAIRKTLLEFEAPYGQTHKEMFEVLARYNVQGAIANGAFGYVCAADDSEKMDDEGAPVGMAIKKIVRLFEGQRRWVCGSRELQMMLHFDHPKVMAAKDIFIPLGANLTSKSIEARKEQFDDVYIVMDFMDQSLREFINSQDEVEAPINPVTGKPSTQNGKVTPMQLQHRTYLMFQLLQGMGYLHRNAVMHRDMKPANVLVDLNYNAKICDFGQGRGIGDGNQAVRTMADCCTQWYSAPENLTITQEQDSSTMIDLKIFHAQDVWSLGCIAAEMIIGRPLFEVSERGGLPQLKLIVSTMGMPTHEELNALNREGDTPLAEMEIFLKQWNVPSESKLREILVSPLGEEEQSPDEVNMVISMLKYNQTERITIEDAIRNPCFAPFVEEGQDPVDLLGKAVMFPFTPKTHLESLPQAKELIWNLFLERHPEVAELTEALLLNEAHDAAKKAAAEAEAEKND